MYLKLPPRIKVLEAVSAVAKGRVIKEDGAFRVSASAGNREYLVILQGDFVYSNDNGTLYRGYIGYPIIAAMIVEGIVPDFRELGNALKDIPWAELNAKMASYRKVEDYVKEVARRSGIEKEKVDKYIANVLGLLKEKRLKFKDMAQSTLVP